MAQGGGEPRPEDLTRFLDDFRGRRLWQFVVAALVIAMAIGVAFTQELDAGASREFGDTLGLVFLGVVIAALGFTFYNWRCPSCRKYLGKRVFIDSCPRCEVPFTRKGLARATSWMEARGASISARKPGAYCQRCGGAIPADRAFCPECGARQG